MPTTIPQPTRLINDGLRITSGVVIIAVSMVGALTTHDPLIEAALICLIVATAVCTGITATKATLPVAVNPRFRAVHQPLDQADHAVLGSIHRDVADVLEQVNRVAQLQHANLDATRCLAATYDQGAPGTTDQHPLPYWGPANNDAV